VFGHVLLLVAILQGATLVRVLRGDAGVQRGYAFVVGAVLFAAIHALGEAEPFLGIIALALSLLTVMIPWCLEQISRAALARTRLVWVARIASIRAMLMPGAGLSHQLPMLRGLMLLETKGADAALVHFKDLVARAGDGETAMIHEQIISTLFYAHRWTEGIDHYERSFRRGYAALRPSLAVALVRAYGELRLIDRAAGLLRAMEEGPLGSDPRTAEAVARARLTFLAYSGESTTFDRIVADESYRSLGVSRAGAVLFHGIARGRAGDVVGAEKILERVPGLATSRDRQVVSASKKALEQVCGGGQGGPDAAVQLEPEQRAYAQLVANRLNDFLEFSVANPVLRVTWMTYGLLACLGAVFTVVNAEGGGGPGLLARGALIPEMWSAGSWWRVFSAPWIHTDFIGLLFDVYALWIAGQIVERCFGPVRMALATVGGAVTGLLVGMSFAPDLASGIAGGNLLAIGAITAGLWGLTPSRTPMLATRIRRNLLLTLSVVFLANLLATLPGPYGQGSSPVTLAVCVAVSSFVVVFPRTPPRWVLRVFAGCAAGLVMATVAAFVMGANEDVEDLLFRQKKQVCSQRGLEFQLPSTFVVVSEERRVKGSLLIVEGFIDGLELGAKNVVQIAVADARQLYDRPGGAAGQGKGAFGEKELATGWFAVDTSMQGVRGTRRPSSISTELAKLIDADSDHYRAVDLLQNGELVGRVVERRIETSDGERILMIAATPAHAMEHGDPFYAQILKSAVVVGDTTSRKEARCRY